MSLFIMPGPARRRALAAALIVTGAVCAPAALHAQTQPPSHQQEEDPGVLAREAIDKLMRALAGVIQNLPQYAMPEMNERGDIIIRRINPRAEKPRPPENPDETRT
jgi:hypothetical protein